MPGAPRGLGAIHRLHRGLLLGGLLLLLLLQWGATAYWIAREREANRDRAEAVLRQIAVAMHDQTQLLLSEVQTSLEMAAYWLSTRPSVDPRNDHEFVELLELLKSRSGGMTEIRLLRRDGRGLTVPGDDDGFNVSDRPYFQIQRDVLTRGWYVGEPIVSRINGEYIVPISLPLREPVGELIALSAAVRLDRLVPIYDGIRFKPDGTIGLLRSDGKVLARVPMSEEYLGRSLADTEDYRVHVWPAQSGTYLSGPSALDGVRRLISFSKLDQYPMTIAVSAGIDNVDAPWRQSRRLMLLGGALLSLVLIAGAGLMLYALNVRRHSEQQLERMALYDALTGTLNRHAFEQAAHREFERAIRLLRPLTVVTLDLDHFKRVNDTYGHEAGDAVLRQVASAWTRELRITDLLGRTGGEEFVVVMPDTDAAAAFRIAERLLDTTRATAIEADGMVLRVTASIGAATASPFDYTFEDLLRRADRALYAAKDGGRDRAVVADAPA